jgi:hypothetical protein
MTSTYYSRYFSLVAFSVFICIISYWFTLTNFALTIDSEQSFMNTSVSMDLGRWATNLIRCQIFGSITPFFTLFVGLVFYSLAAVEMSQIFKLKGVLSYLFCAFLLSFPQMSYQLFFTMQADAIAIGFFVSALAMKLYLENSDTSFTKKSILTFISVALLLMFVTAIYQALLFIPIIIFIIVFFQKTLTDDFDFKIEFKKTLHFIALLITSVVLYYISIKILCPSNSESGFMASYMSQSTNNRFIDFYNLWVDILRGNMFYGNKTFMLVSLLSCVFLVMSAVKKTNFIYKLIALFLLLFVPFFISIFITTGSTPRLFVTAGIVFAFLMVQFISNFKKFENFTLFICMVICLTNIYFITNLFQSNYKIFNHDLKLAEKIDSAILTKYPKFNPNLDYVYFYGKTSDSEYNQFRIPNSDIFTSSFFQWDNGSNNRILDFIKFNNIANYRVITSKEDFSKINDSVNYMSTWPKPSSIKQFGKIVVVKLGNQKGAKLAIE